MNVFKKLWNWVCSLFREKTTIEKMVAELSAEDKLRDAVVKYLNKLKFNCTAIDDKNKRGAIPNNDADVVHGRYLSWELQETVPTAQQIAEAFKEFIDELDAPPFDYYIYHIMRGKRVNADTGIPTAMAKVRYIITPPNA